MEGFGPSQKIRIIRLLSMIDRAHRNALETEIGKWGIHRTQHLLLMYLSRHSEVRSQKDIAAHFEISTAAVANALKKMEADGLVKRRSSDADARFNVIEPTSKGLELIEKTHRSFSEIDDELFKGLTQSEMELLEKLLLRLYGNLKPEKEGCL